jgi:hypothetical protein
MTKRIAAIDAISDLNDASKENAAIMAENLAKIPQPTFVDSILWDLVYSDWKFNVRDDESYSLKENETLYRSLMDRGLETRGGDNLSFSLQSNGRYLTLSGNLRMEMMRIGREEITQWNLANPNAQKPMPFENLFGLVFTGLTRDQEVSLMADHTMRKGLNEFELCKEVAETCYHAKLTDEKAAIKFGLKKSAISRMRMRYAMPTVFAEYRKEKGKDKNVPFVKVGQVALTRLYSCYLADQEAGCPFRTEGMNFKLAWKEHLLNPESTGKKPETVKPMEREKIVNAAKSFPATFGNNPEIQATIEILQWSANEDRDGKPINVQTAVEKLKEYCDSLRSDRDGLENALETVTNERDNLRAENDRLSQEVETFKATTDRLTQELTAIKARKAKNGSNV